MATTLSISLKWRPTAFLSLVASLVLAMSAFAPVAWAEEAPPSEPPAAETPAPEAAPAEPEYVPPPEASEGAGGWAVVDPETGNVHGVIVGTIETYNAWGGKIGQEYMGCHANCVLRFQTRATADGNVAGWHGTSTQIDANGNAVQTNDGSVKWNAQTRTFSIGTQNNGGVTTRTLVPELTARDPQRSDLSTGIINIETRALMNADGQSGRVRVFQDSLSSPTSLVTIEYPLWSPEAKTFSYLLREGWRQDPSIVEETLGAIGSDVDEALIDDGYATTETTVDEETGETTENVVVDSEDGFVVAIQSVTRQVLDFLGSLFGISGRP